MFNNIYRQKIKRQKIALKSRKRRIKELEDKVSMLEFFYDGNGFTKRGLRSSVQIAKYISTLENKTKELEEKYLKATDEGTSWAHLENLKRRNEQLEMTAGTLRTFSNEQATCIERLEKETAELKAGKIQWHDLQKDHNDLPEKMGLGSIEVYIEYKDGVNDFAYYRFDKKCWERSENEELAENVIAWCEIPRFENGERK